MTRWEIIHRNCLEEMRAMEPDTVDAIVTDPPYHLAFMGKDWDNANLSVAPDFGYWFVGLTDGEGCFRIHKNNNGNRYSVQFSIKLRRDDRPVLEKIQKTLGVGKVRDVEGDGSSKPQAIYIVESQADCRVIACVFLEYPLKSKKARDFLVWFDALQEWTNLKKGNRWHGKGSRGRMPKLHRELREVRTYDEAPRPVNASELRHWIWAREALRVAKPGAHLVAFGGTRTHHRLMCALEDAGWEIRDCLMWVYGSGFPKSLDVSKAIDDAADAEGGWRQEDHPGRAGPRRTKSALHGQVDYVRDDNPEGLRHIYEPATDAAKQWDGWGTNLKPAWEPIVLARKPLVGTVAANVLEHGTGGLNIDGCRVDGQPSGLKPYTRRVEQRKSQAANHLDVTFTDHLLGRWPANVVHDGSEEVVGLFPQQAGGGAPLHRLADKTQSTFGEFQGHECPPGIGASSGSAARFFYCAKASRSEREEGLEWLAKQPGGSNAKGYTEDVAQGLDRNRPVGNHHPTVKPLALMAWLCRLICPPRGMILDPFCGSGSTGIAAATEGFGFIGIEIDPEYCEIARQRITVATNQTDLFIDLPPS